MGGWSGVIVDHTLIMLSPYEVFWWMWKHSKRSSSVFLLSRL